MYGTTPRHFETQFRKDLGNVTPHMHLVEVATNEFLETQPLNLNAYSDVAKKYGHKRLHVDQRHIIKIKSFIHLSHLAFINSRADGFCDDILGFPDIFPDLDREEFKKVFGKTKGDKLRKTLTMIYASRMDDVNLAKRRVPERIANEYAGKVEIAIVDYYRLIRNSEFHGGLSRSNTFRSLSPQMADLIFNEYKHRPNLPEELTTRDVILFSQAWQKISKNICSNLVEIGPLVVNICKENKGKTEKRRENAITQKLAQDYLQSKDTIDMLRSHTNGWVA